jgi:hypothetical protein
MPPELQSRWASKPNATAQSNATAHLTVAFAEAIAHARTLAIRRRPMIPRFPASTDRSRRVSAGTGRSSATPSCISNPVAERRSGWADFTKERNFRSRPERDSRPTTQQNGRSGFSGCAARWSGSAARYAGSGRAESRHQNARRHWHRGRFRIDIE